MREGSLLRGDAGGGFPGDWARQGIRAPTALHPNCQDIGIARLSALL